MKFCALGLATWASLLSLAADQALEPGYSAIVVRVIDDSTSRPVAGAHMQTMCGPYTDLRPTTDEGGRATIPIYKTWVRLKVSCDGYTHSLVTLNGTNDVGSFCTNAIVKLKRRDR